VSAGSRASQVGERDTRQRCKRSLMLELMAHLKIVTERGTSQRLWESTAVPGFFKKLAEAETCMAS